MSIREAFEEIPLDTGVSYLKIYYGLLATEHSEQRDPFHGSYFDSIDTDITGQYSDRITAADLYSVAMLQTRIERAAGIEILNNREAITSELSLITTRPLGELSAEECESQLGQESSARKLWDLLINVYSIGPTRASKIMARKRPDLIPINDSVINRVADISGKNDWSLWWEALTVDSVLNDRAQELRQAIGRPDLSILRVLDVVLWYSGSFGIHSKN